MSNDPTYLLVLPGVLDPLDEAVEVVDDLTDPALVVALLKGLEADLGDDADATADNRGL